MIVTAFMHIIGMLFDRWRRGRGDEGGGGGRGDERDY